MNDSHHVNPTRTWMNGWVLRSPYLGKGKKGGGKRESFDQLPVHSFWIAHACSNCSWCRKRREDPPVDGPASWHENEARPTNLAEPHRTIQLRIRRRLHYTAEGQTCLEGKGSGKVCRKANDRSTTVVAPDDDDDSATTLEKKKPDCVSAVLGPLLTWTRAPH